MAESSVAAAEPSRSRIRAAEREAGCRYPGGYDGTVIDPPAEELRPDPPSTPPSKPPTTPSSPGERRLAHPPSDRYRVAEPVPPGPERAASPGRGAIFAVVAAGAGAAAVTVLGGVMTVSAGLLVVAATTGWAVGLGLRVGAGQTLPADRRVRLAVGLALLAIVLGQLGLWLYARTEGGVLGPLDYLGEAFGLLVPLELVTAAIASWRTAR